jgi:hypothetical protein
MHLDGSCCCGAVRFSLEAATPVPFLRCYCSICRKTAGGGGYAINLGGRFDTLIVEGELAVGIFRATIEGEESPAERRFCTRCGTALWLWDPRWPALVHPFASAIDTPLPVPPEVVHIMLAAKPDWVGLEAADSAACHDGYPPESLEDWHRRHGLLDEV